MTPEELFEAFLNQLYSVIEVQNIGKCSIIVLCFRKSLRSLTNRENMQMGIYIFFRYWYMAFLF